ncbi:MAG: hypothetical protein RL131_433 [Bacteroidota bacterium]
MDLNAICYSEGKFSRLSDTTLPISDLGIQRGYGIFDFLRVRNTTPLFLADHITRFYQSADQMNMKVDLSSNQLREIILHLIDRNNYPHSGIRILLTGGDSEDGYALQKPRLSIQHQPLQPPPDVFSSHGIKLFSYSHQRQLSNVKTTDYIMAIWLQPWLKSLQGDDILYQNDKSVLECPRSNVFMITKNQELITPEEHVLKGVTRKQILDLAQSIGFKTTCRAVPLEEMMSAEEVFISSSTKRIVPVSEINGKKIGNNSFRFSELIWKAFYELELGQG